MGFSYCESYWKAVARAVSNKAKKEHIRLRRMCRDYSWAIKAHEGRYGDNNQQIDDCHKVRGFKIYLPGDAVWDISFQCPCENPRNLPRHHETYKGFPIFVKKTWTGSKYYRQDYFKITVEGANNALALYEGPTLEDLLTVIREKIDNNELKDVWGNLMAPSEYITSETEKKDDPDTCLRATHRQR